MKLRHLAVFLGGYAVTVAAFARLYHGFSGSASPANVAIGLAIALLIGFGAGTSETAARHGVSFVLASFCGALTILLSFCLNTAGAAVAALPYVFFWTNAIWMGLQAARICRTALNAPSLQ
jgi:asparagine N-glycosylation enzyme membrane subunit Stt3